MSQSPASAPRVSWRWPVIMGVSGLALGIALTMAMTTVDWRTFSATIVAFSSDTLIGIALGVVVSIIVARAVRSRDGQEGLLKDVVAPIASFLSFVVAFAALRANVQTQHELKTVDLLSHYHERYDHLYDTKAKASTEKDQREYYQRFWELIVEEYGDWSRTYIPQEHWSAWMKQREQEFRDNKHIGDDDSMTYREGWDWYKRCAAGRQDTFIDFMGKVFCGNRAVYENGPLAKSAR